MKNISWTISESTAVELSMEDGEPSRLTETLAELEDTRHEIVFATENLVSGGDKRAILGTVTYWNWHMCTSLIYVQISPVFDGDLEEKADFVSAFLGVLPEDYDDIISCESALFDYLVVRQAATKAEAVEAAVVVTRRLNMAAHEALQHIPVGQA